MFGGTRRARDRRRLDARPDPPDKETIARGFRADRRDAARSGNRERTAAPAPPPSAPPPPRAPPAPPQAAPAGSSPRSRNAGTCPPATATPAHRGDGRAA